MRPCSILILGYDILAKKVVSCQSNAVLLEPLRQMIRREMKSVGGFLRILSGALMHVIERYHNWKFVSSSCLYRLITVFSYSYLLTVTVCTHIRLLTACEEYSIANFADMAMGT